MKDNINNSKYEDYLDFATHKESLVRLIYLVLVSLGTVAGNVLVFVAILRFKSLRRATNVMLGSLAFADFLVGTVTVPLYILWMTLPGIFDASIFMCGLVLLSCLLVVTASQISLMILSVEQYFAVCHPFLHRNALISHPRLHAFAVISTWAISLVTTALSFLAFNTRAETCSYYGAFDKKFLFFASIIGVICPFFAIISLNVKVLFDVRAHDKRKTSLGMSSKRPKETAKASGPNGKLQIGVDSEQDITGSQNQLVEMKSNKNCKDKNMSFRQFVNALLKYNKLRRRQNGYNISTVNQNPTVEVVKKKKNIFFVEVKKNVSLGYNSFSSMILESTENIPVQVDSKDLIFKYIDNKAYVSNAIEHFELKNEVDMKSVVEKTNWYNYSPTMFIKDGANAKEDLLKTNIEKCRGETEFLNSVVCIGNNTNQDNENTLAANSKETEQYRKRSFSLDSNIYKDNSIFRRFTRSNSFSGFQSIAIFRNKDRLMVADTSTTKSIHNSLDLKIQINLLKKEEGSSFGKATQTFAGDGNSEDVTVSSSVKIDRISIESNDRRFSIANNTTRDRTPKASNFIKDRSSFANGVNRDRASIASVAIRDRASIASIATRALAASSISSRVAYMMALVCATFILAWCPFFVVVLMNTFCGDCDLAYYLNVAVIIAFTKSGANPVVYGLCNAAFRRAYSQLLESLCIFLKPRRLAGLR